jgi:hypothetical protein
MGTSLGEAIGEAIAAGGGSNPDISQKSVHRRHLDRRNTEYIWIPNKHHKRHNQFLKFIIIFHEKYY